MSSLPSLFPSIFQSYSLPELLSVVRLSFDSEEIKEAERILIRRDQDLRSEVRDLKTKVEILKKERDSLKRLHGSAELEKISMEKDLKKCQLECQELSDRVKCLIDGKIQAGERYKNAMEAKRMESEGRKKIEELEDPDEIKMVHIKQTAGWGTGWYHPLADESTGSSSGQLARKRMRTDEGQISPTIEVPKSSPEEAADAVEPVAPVPSPPLQPAQGPGDDDTNDDPILAPSPPPMTPRTILFPSDSGPLS